MELFPKVKELGYNDQELSSIIENFVAKAIAGDGCPDAACVKTMEQPLYDPIGNYKLLQNMWFSHASLARIINKNLANNPKELSLLRDLYTEEQLISMWVEKWLIRLIQKNEKIESL